MDFLHESFQCWEFPGGYSDIVELSEEEFRKHAHLDQPTQMTKREQPLIPTQNTLREPIRRTMIDLLKQQLADVLDLGLQAKQAHGNVKGPHFIGLHGLFDKVAEELEEFSDDMAERAVELGSVALGTLQIVSKKSRLSSYPLNLTSGQKHIAALSGALAKFGTTTRAAIDSAAKAGDADTADLFTEVSRGVDKLLWMVEAHAQSKN